MLRGEPLDDLRGPVSRAVVHDKPRQRRNALAQHRFNGFADAILLVLADDVASIPDEDLFDLQRRRVRGLGSLGLDLLVAPAS